MAFRRAFAAGGRTRFDRDASGGGTELSTLERRPALRTLPHTRATIRSERRLVRTLIGVDGVALVAAAAAAVALEPNLRESLATAIVWSLATVAATLFVFAFYRLYERDRQEIAVSTLDEVQDFFNALSLVSFVELAVGLELWPRAIAAVGTRGILTYWLAAIILLPAVRGAFRHVLVPLLGTPQNTLIVGAGQVGQLVARKIRKHPEYNLRLVGFLDDEPHPVAAELDDVRVIGSEEDLVTAIRRYSVSRIILAFSRRPPERLLEVIREAGLRDVHLSVIPRYFELFAAGISLADVDGMPVLEIPAARLSRLARATKRAFDLTFAVVGLLALAPLFAAIAVLIKLDSPGPIFFRQTRMGHGGTFRIFKFRTMIAEAEGLRDTLLHANESTGPLFKIRADPRVTRVGRKLRALSLDEIPQLLNVVSGEMSLVGPRPFVVHEDAKIQGWARRRLDLTPGITGPWQVLGRNDIAFDEMIRLDYLYVTSWSLWGDIKLLMRTIPVVLRHRGY